MTDDPLLHDLAAADTEPPPGAPFGAEQLAARAAAQNRRRAVLAMGLLLAVPLAWRLWPAPSAAADLPGELRALAAQLEGLQAALACPRPPLLAAAATATATDRLQVRAALAEARALALTDHRLTETRR